jgi:hypothetical protein
MSICESSVRAFGGGPLLGDRIVRLIYLDETGHDRKNKIAAVAGVVLDPDKQWLALSERVRKLQEEVPDKFKSTFVFHATDLYYRGGKYAEDWPLDIRRELLMELISLPRQLEIPIVFGFTTKPATEGKAFSESIVSHSLAYALCLKAADSFMTDCAEESEIAMVVAEERPEAHKALRAAHKMLVDPILRKAVLLDVADKFSITRVKAPPTFASKDEEILLQIADACAFVIQRFLNGAEGFQPLLDSMLGPYQEHARLDDQTEGSPYCAYISWRTEPAL